MSKKQIFIPKLGVSIKLLFWQTFGLNILGLDFGIIHSVTATRVEQILFGGFRTQVTCRRDEENWMELFDCFINSFLFIHLSP